MVKVHNKKKKPKDRRNHRKMTPYTLTGEEKIDIVWIKNNDTQLEDLEYPTKRKLKQVRRDLSNARRSEKKITRHNAKSKIKQEINDFRNSI